MAGAPVERREGWNPDHRLEWTPVDASEFDLVDPYPPPEPPLWWRVRTSIAGFGGPVLVMAALVAGAQFWILKDDTPHTTQGIIRTAGAERTGAVARSAATTSSGEPAVLPRSTAAPHRETDEAAGEAPARAREPARDVTTNRAASPPPPPTTRVAADVEAPAVRADRSSTPRPDPRPSSPEPTASPSSALSPRWAPVSDPPSVRPRPAPAAQQQQAAAARAAADGRDTATPTAGVEQRAPASAARTPDRVSAPSMASTSADSRRAAPAGAVTSSREAAPASGTAAASAPGVAPPVPRADSTGSESTAAAVGNAAAASAAVSARRVAEQQIEDTLSRFEAAYESLDADAASRIWPGVDRRALARAFQGLRSQELTFTRCRMAIETVAASVDCDGWTTFVPRIGSQEPRTEERRWNFQLRKRGEGWTIAEARVR